VARAEYFDEQNGSSEVQLRVSLTAALLVTEINDTRRLDCATFPHEHHHLLLTQRPARLALRKGSGLNG
jgi:hypothetical protein